MNAKNLEQQATTLRDQGKGYEAVEKYQRAKELYLKNGQLAQAAGCEHMIGVAYKIENDIDQAMPAYDKAIKEYAAANDLLGEGRVERDIGVMYEYRDQLEPAKLHLIKSQQLLEAAPENAVTVNGDKRDAELGITLAKVGLIELRMSQFDDAKKHMTSGLALIRRAGHPFYEMTSLLHLAALDFATEYYSQMLAGLEAALGLIYEYSMEDNQARRLAQIWGLMAHGYLHCGNSETAHHFARKSFTVIDSLSDSAQEPLKKDIKADVLKQKLKL